MVNLVQGSQRRLPRECLLQTDQESYKLKEIAPEIDSLCADKGIVQVPGVLKSVTCHSHSPVPGTQPGFDAPLGKCFRNKTQFALWP